MIINDRDKLPLYPIFDCLPKKVSDLLSDFAYKTHWNYPIRGLRYYQALPMLKAILIYYLKQLRSLDELVSYLIYYPNVAKSIGFHDFIPSRNTFSNYLSTLGPDPFEDLFYQFVAIMDQEGYLQGIQLVIDSTHVPGWSIRKSKDKTNS